MTRTNHAGNFLAEHRMQAGPVPQNGAVYPGSIPHSSLSLCILIPVYNNPSGLVRSLNSIIFPSGQSLVIVVDDGSASPIDEKTLLAQLVHTIPLQVIRSQKNAGITNALNLGLDFIYAHYKVDFIARLDCGDTCHPDRFIRQVAFMKTHPDIDLLGTWCYFSNPDTRLAYKYVTPTQHRQIKKSMYFRNVFIHPTVLWRASSLEYFRYPHTFPHAEDYALFYEVLLKKQVAILDEFLVICEINPRSISVHNRLEQLLSRMKVIRSYGSNPLLVLAGSLKLRLLRMIPNRLVYQLKIRLFKAGK